MKKIIISSILIIVIGLIFSFIFLYFLLNLLPKENTVNKKLRVTIAKNITLRNILRLNQVGDAKNDYLSDNNFKKLEIIVYSNHEGITDNVKNNILLELSKTIKKPDGITFRTLPLDNFEKEDVDDIEINNLLDNYPILVNKNAVLHIFILNSYIPNSTYAGIVKDANNIIIFIDPIKKLSFYEKNTDNALTSTILHEFAHILGAGHIDDDNCILSSKVENISYDRPKAIIINFCEKDLEEINKNASN